MLVFIWLDPVEPQAAENIALMRSVQPESLKTLGAKQHRNPMQVVADYTKPFANRSRTLKPHARTVETGLLIALEKQGRAVGHAGEEAQAARPIRP